MPSNQSLRDSIHLIPVIKGVFTIPDSLITTPQAVTLAFSSKDEYLLIPILLAPEYRVFLKADALNTSTFYTTFVWSGFGSLINNFNSEMQRIQLNDYDKAEKSNFDAWYTNSRREIDSLYYYNSKILEDKQDPNFTLFKKIIWDEIQFERLNNLMENACSIKGLYGDKIFGCDYPCEQDDQFMF